MITTIFNAKHSLIRANLTPSFLSGVFLALVSITPIQAQTPENSHTVAQLPPGYSPETSQEQVFSSPFNNQYQYQYEYSQNYCLFFLFLKDEFSQNDCLVVLVLKDEFSQNDCMLVIVIKDELSLNDSNVKKEIIDE